MKYSRSLFLFLLLFVMQKSGAVYAAEAQSIYAEAQAQLLNMYLPGLPDQAIEERIAEQHQFVSIQAQNVPDTEAGAIVVLSTGMTPEQIEELAIAYELDFNGIEFKHTRAGQNTVETMYLGARSLNTRRAPLSRTITDVLNMERIRVLQMKTAGAPPTQEQLRDIVMGPGPLAFRLEVVSHHESLFALTTDQRIAAVIYDRMGRIRESFNVQQHNPLIRPGSGVLIERARPLSEGPPPGLEGLPVYPPGRIPGH